MYLNYERKLESGGIAPGGEVYVTMLQNKCIGKKNEYKRNLFI